MDNGNLDLCAIGNERQRGGVGGAEGVVQLTVHWVCEQSAPDMYAILGERGRGGGWRA